MKKIIVIILIFWLLSCGNISTSDEKVLLEDHIVYNNIDVNTEKHRIFHSVYHIEEYCYNCSN